MLKVEQSSRPLLLAPKHNPITISFRSAISAISLAEGIGDSSLMTGTTS